MQTTIDAAGRIVIPKAIREALGLQAGAAVEISIDGVSIRIDGAQAPTRGFTVIDGFAVLDPVEGAIPMTVEDVRNLRMELQDRSLRS
jgi:AbrB family looped-hinge helix DNA binding protein